MEFSKKDIEDIEHCVKFCRTQFERSPQNAEHEEAALNLTVLLAKIKRVKKNKPSKPHIQEEE